MQLGILGGLSWVSSLEYYRIINEEYIKESPDGANPRIILNSMDFNEATENFKNQNRANEMMQREAQKLVQGGCELLVIASNTAHFCYEGIHRASSVPMIHIGDAVGERLKELGARKVLLLGTRFTMNLDFYRQRLENNFQIKLKTPLQEDKRTVDQIIYNELVQQIFTDQSKQAYMDIISREAEQGADAVIMGCTEIPLLLKGVESPIPLVDSTLEHCRSIVKTMLKQKAP